MKKFLYTLIFITLYSFALSQEIIDTTINNEQLDSIDFKKMPFEIYEEPNVQINKIGDTTKGLNDTSASRNASVLVDTTKIDSSLMQYYYLPPNNLRLEKINIDTSLTGVHRFNPIHKDHKNFYVTTGNIGLASKSIVFDGNNNSNLIIGNNVFSNYMFFPQNSRFYNLLVPLSEFLYANGSKKEQFFYIYHAQRISKNVISSLKYHIINSPGRFVKQGSSNAAFKFNTHFITPNNGYELFAGYCHNRIDVTENGGIISEESLQENNYNANVKFIGENIKVSNWIKNNHYFLRQKLGLGNKTNKETDTAMNNYALGYLNHEFSYENYWSVYEDDNPNSGYYPYVYYDTTKTYDSLYYQKYENKLSWSNADFYHERLFNFEFFAKHQYFEISQTKGEEQYKQFNFYDTTAFKNTLTRIIANDIKTYNQYSVGGTFMMRKFAGISPYFKLEYYLKGYREEDFIWQSSISKSIKKEHLITGGINLANSEPAWKHQHYSSNHFIWDYNFEKEFSKELFGRYNAPGLHAEISLNQINNFTYFDYNARPKQYKDNLEILKLLIFKKIELKPLVLDNTLIYQDVSNSNILHLPEFIAIQSTYLNLTFFDKALYLQPGFDIRFYTKYHADAYMPSIRQFYLQNEEKTGNYPIIDIFMNFKIKRARMFFKLAHANDSFIDRYYFGVPNYPMDGIEFKFGIKWKLLN